ncbi:MAG: hypothetical protein LBD22_06745 [Spirochaetaceae bacterium]|jgi:hypothetical protein|nr:hypothetical protein [Spirochaetaceae bacterium]
MPIFNMIMARTKFIVLIVCVARLGALDTTLDGIADDSILRTQLAKTLFVDTPRSVVARQARTETLASGVRVQVRSEWNGGDEFSIILAREHNGQFTGWGQGSFILTRSVEDGAVRRIRIFLRSDPYTYIQFRPLSAAKSEFDAVVYDAFLARSQPVAVPFNQLLEMPLSEVFKIMNGTFPRRYFEPETADYRDVRTLIAGIRREIRPLEFGDDGAMDENGKYVFINSLSAQETTQGLNCSGFAKWVIDGLLRPVTGKRLAVAPLKQPYGTRGTNFTAPFERSRDPFFGLDWVRNLAAAAGSAFKSPAFGSLDEIEVRAAPFQAVLRRTGRTSTVRHYPGHQPNAGYGFEGIQPLLYTLAIDEPGHIFLGAINREGGTPPLRTYFHVAVLIPYFDEQKVFHVAVFESAEETSFNRFRVRYPTHHINLCRVPIETAFSP